MRIRLIYVLLTLSYILQAQKKEPFRLDSLAKKGVYLNSGWKYSVDDKPEFAQLDYIDTSWQSIANFADIGYLPQIPKDGKIFWLRLPLQVDAHFSEPLAMMIEQTGASEVYLNGKRLYQFGNLSKNSHEIKGFSPHLKPYLLPLDTFKNQVLAVRYAIQPNVKYVFFMGHANRLLRIRVSDFRETMSFYQNKYVFDKNVEFKIGVFSILCIMFLTFYIFYAQQKANFYFFAYAGLYVLFVKCFDLRLFSKYPEQWVVIYWAILIINFIASICLLTGIYTLFKKRKNKVYWGLFIFGLVSMPFGIYLIWGWTIPMMLFIFSIYGVITNIALKAVKRNHKGAKILVIGGVGVLAAWFLCLLGLFVPPVFAFYNVFQSISILALPLAIAVYVGYDFAMTNHSLQEQLNEVERLSFEKQEILTEQKDMLEKQVKARTNELSQSLKELKKAQNQLVQYETQQALEKERTRIARDMHDDISSGLSAINLLANYIKNNPLSNETQTEVQHIAASSKELNQRIREIIWSINSESDNVEDLSHFIRRYVSDFDEVHPIETRFIADNLPDLKLPNDAKRNLFLCVKEALNNAAKYARASIITVEMNIVGKNLTLTIKDNGIGFDHENAVKNGGNGLKNIIERMKQIGGNVAFRNEQGSQIILTTTI